MTAFLPAITVEDISSSKGSPAYSDRTAFPSCVSASAASTEDPMTTVPLLEMITPASAEIRLDAYT